MGYVESSSSLCVGGQVPERVPVSHVSAPYTVDKPSNCHSVTGPSAVGDKAKPPNASGLPTSIKPLKTHPCASIPPNKTFNRDNGQSCPPSLTANNPTPHSGNYVQLTESQDELLQQISNPTTKCTPYYTVLKCDCGHTAVISGCMKKNCIFCKTYLGRHRGSAAMQKLILLQDAEDEFLEKCDRYNLNSKVCYTVFTIPEFLRPQYTNKKKCQTLRKLLWKLLKSFGATFGYEVTHPISEKHPNIFHPHFNFVWRQNKQYPAYIDVARLREDFRKILKVNYQVNAWHDYVESFIDIKHICNYVCRTFPGYSEWAGIIHWFGVRPKVTPEKKGCKVCGIFKKAIGTIPQHIYETYLESFRASGTEPPGEIPASLIVLFADNESKETAEPTRQDSRHFILDENFFAWNEKRRVSILCNS